MADLVKSELVITCTFTQKEFSIVTRALAGHQLKPHDIPIAVELNKKLLAMRLTQANEFAVQAARALQVAEEEDQQRNSNLTGHSDPRKAK